MMAQLEETDETEVQIVVAIGIAPLSIIAIIVGYVAKLLTLPKAVQVVAPAVARVVV